MSGAAESPAASAAPDDLTLAWRAVLDRRDPQARLVLADLADMCGVARTTHVPGSPDASGFQEGKRAVFLYVAGRLGLPLIPET